MSPFVSTAALEGLPKVYMYMTTLHVVVLMLIKCVACGCVVCDVQDPGPNCGDALIRKYPP